MTTQQDQQQYGPTAPTVLELRGLRFMSDPGAGTGEGAGAAAPNGGQEPGAGAAANGSGTATGQEPGGEQVPVNPATGQPLTPEEQIERLTARISKVNNEAKDWREKYEARDTEAADATKARDAVLAALGLKPDGSNADPDPAQIQQQFEAVTATNATLTEENAGLRRELALSSAVTAHGANLEELRDSRAFLDKLTAIDPADAAAIGELVKTTVASNDRFKAAPPPAAGSGGTPHHGQAGKSGAAPSLQSMLAARQQG